MSVSNPWLNPFQRSYSQIKTSLINKMKTKVPEVTDYSEGNIFTLIISMFSAIAENIHYYIDNMARETFFVSARRYSSLVKHARMVDYHIHSGIPSKVDIIVYSTNNLPISGDLIIPVNTKFIDSQGNTWLTSKTMLWAEGTYSITIPLVQKELIPEMIIGRTASSKSMLIPIEGIPSGSFYVEGSMNMVIGNEQWSLVETFAYSTPYDKHYKVEVDEARKPYIKFGDGVHGFIPLPDNQIVVSYYITHGANGNVDSGTITKVPGIITEAINHVACNNQFASVGGSDYETFEQMKARVPLHIRTLGVAITKQDYEDVVMSVPGVGQAFVNYICGKFLEIYITPAGGGIAPKSLLDEVYLKVLDKKVITTNVRVLPIHQSEIHISCTITGKPSFTSNSISNQVKKALIDNYGYSTSKIGQSIRLSDLYALIDNQSMVDHLSIDKLYIKPYPNRLGNTTAELAIAEFNVTHISKEATYLFRYVSIMGQPPIFEIYDVDGFINSKIEFGEWVKINDRKNNNIFSLKLDRSAGGAYKYGDTWSINLLPNDMDQTVGVSSLPIFTDKTINLKINETV